MKALFAAAAVVLAAGASANTVTVSNTSHKDPTGFGTAFTDTDALSFTLADTTWVAGLLITKSSLSALPAVDITGVTLLNVSTGQSIDWMEQVGINWKATRVGVEQWALPGQQLGAGLWELNITGVSYSNKQGSGYTASVELPEPGSAGLALAAVAGAFVASRRRKSA